MQNHPNPDLNAPTESALPEPLRAFWCGFEKIGKNGETLPLTAPQWAAVKDIKTGLIWATNWEKQDNFPVTCNLTWYRKGAGSFNGGKNTQHHVQRVNEQAWCGKQDWHLPSEAEMESLVTALCTVHIDGRDVRQYNQHRYQAIFQHDALAAFWFASGVTVDDDDWGDAYDGDIATCLNFYSVRFDRAFTKYEHWVRTVRVDLES